jgi:hypothetical protein
MKLAYIQQTRSALQLKNKGYSGQLIKSIPLKSWHSEDAFNAAIQELYTLAKSLGYTKIDDTFNNKIVDI